MRRAGALVCLLALGVCRPMPAQSPNAVARRRVVVASKPFGESYLLAEMFAQLLEARGIAVERRPGLGATEVAFAALRSGAIDVYPEYTGTGLLAILHAPPMHDAGAVFDSVQRAFEQRWNIRWLPPLGFENTYAIAVRAETASRYHLRTLDDLASASSKLVAGFTPDFIGRADGLPGLTHAYHLHFAGVRPLSQALKYIALASGKVDVVDGYSTDGSIARYRLVVLADNRGFFPPYQAAALVGARLQRDDPTAVAVLTELSGRLDVRVMRALNQRVEIGGEPVPAVAASALRSLGLTGGAAVPVTAAGIPAASRRSFGRYLWERRAVLWGDTERHLLLVAIPLLTAILTAVPLGLWLEHARGAAEP
ncbi:MAG TPA: glycine betaine ABC transporter substrate-binding protein, partial [Gemmatimonadaceae bacterium]